MASPHALHAQLGCLHAWLILSVEAVRTQSGAERRGMSRGLKTEPVYVDNPQGMSFGELDVDATLRQSKFPLPPDVLLAKAKAVLGCEFGTKEGSDASCLADDFQFVAPIVGPPLQGRIPPSLWVLHGERGSS
ncbi:unnamed protein product [Polarella glacialis]|uniref:Uncharacterized protein n=1 Tax=Polarella glacialis TaxID=89957 RepID=A0A813IYS6_POLGL|nr:unnamed protein product [Polarella glacialis]